MVAFYGYWKVTTPDPSGLAEKPGKLTSRKLIRITQAAGVAIAALVMIFTFADIGLGILLLTLPSGVITVVGIFATFVYARQLALRIPDDHLARSCRIVMWGIAVTMIISLACFVALALIPSGPWTTSGTNPGQGAAFAFAMGFGCAFMVASVVFGLWSLVLIFRFRRSLTDEAALARATWAATPPGGASSIQNDPIEIH